MDYLYDLRTRYLGAVRARNSVLLHRVAPYGSRGDLVHPATTQRGVVEFAFRVGRRRCIGPEPGLRLAVRGREQRKDR